MADLSWKLVLYHHDYIADIYKMQKLAIVLGYPYFMWNGVVHETKSGNQTKFSVG